MHPSQEAGFEFPLVPTQPSYEKRFCTGSLHANRVGLLENELRVPDCRRWCWDNCRPAVDQMGRCGEHTFAAKHVFDIRPVQNDPLF